MAQKSNLDIAGITRDISLLLSADKSGHGMEHVYRVVTLALAFAKEESADDEVVRLAALLHDADDYKLFGQKHADQLTNILKERLSVTPICVTQSEQWAF